MFQSLLPVTVFYWLMATQNSIIMQGGLIIIIITIMITIFIQGAHFTKTDIQWGPVQQIIEK